MRHYLRDPHSKNNASLIEWLNPDFKPRKHGPPKVRLACIQYQMRKVRWFEEFAAQVTYFVDIAADYQSDFVLLPELFTVQLLSQTTTLSPQEGIKKLAGYAPRVRKLLSSLAVRYGVTLIGGSQISFSWEKLINSCPVCQPDGSAELE